MAIATSFPHSIDPIAETASDYGSDIDEATAHHLLSQAESQPLTDDISLEALPHPLVLQDDGVEQAAHLRLSHAQFSSSPRSFVHKNKTREGEARRVREASIEVEYDEGNRTSFFHSASIPNGETSPAAAPPPEPSQTIDPHLPPIDRFRKRRPISVTDLVSPAWCEQQYEYSLTKYGRVRKTPAMKQGSTVHRELEEQVHVRVPVEVVSKEDKFALRVWNSIHGLRMLRETGLTRELEVWGVLEGEVVIGIIDEIRSTCPDEGMEARLLEDAEKGRGKKEVLPADQRTLTEFLTHSQNASILERPTPALGRRALPDSSSRTYYLVDIKTRQSRTLPTSGSQSRPTHMQLMIYHQLLFSLAANTVPANQVFARYGLDPNAPFSDTFLAQVANLNLSPSPAPSQADSTLPASQKDPLTELLAHNTLSLLWPLLIHEAALTFPPSPPKSTATPSISPLLTAEFRTSRPTHGTDDSLPEVSAGGTLIGQRSFPFDAKAVSAYLADEIGWWRGERETKGVEVEEAFKCRLCEFAEGCAWRATKVEEGLRRVREREGLREKGRSVV